MPNWLATRTFRLDRLEQKTASKGISPIHKEDTRTIEEQAETATATVLCKLVTRICHREFHVGHDS